MRGLIKLIKTNSSIYVSASSKVPPPDRGQGGASLRRWWRRHHHPRLGSVSLALFALLQLHLGHAEVTLGPTANCGRVGDKVVRGAQFRRAELVLGDHTTQGARILRGRVEEQGVVVAVQFDAVRHDSGQVDVLEVEDGRREKPAVEQLGGVQVHQVARAGQVVGVELLVVHVVGGVPAKEKEQFFFALVSLHDLNII